MAERPGGSCLVVGISPLASPFGGTDIPQSEQVVLIEQSRQILFNLVAHYFIFLTQETLSHLTNFRQFFQLAAKDIKLKFKDDGNFLLLTLFLLNSPFHFFS